jgi:hypothetical protein
MIDIMEAIKRPFSDTKKLALGGLMYVIPFLSMITGIFAFGYVLDAVSMTFKKNNKMPEWTDWGNLFVKGLLGLVINLIWSIPLAIVFLITVGTAIIGALSNLSALQAGNFTALWGILAGAGAGIIISIILAILTGYVVPCALFAFVKENKFGAAFNFGSIFKKAFTGKYFVAWILGIVSIVILMVIMMIINMVLGMVPVLGVVLTMIVAALGTFVMLMAYFTILADTYRELK